MTTNADVIPTKVGTHDGSQSNQYQSGGTVMPDRQHFTRFYLSWVPASAGMTGQVAYLTKTKKRNCLEA